MALEPLFVDQRADWFADFRAELLSFPAGKHDDQVDAIGLIGQLLDVISPGEAKPLKREPEPMSDYREIELDDDREDWKVAI
jgi:hypothetical protein